MCQIPFSPYNRGSIAEAKQYFYLTSYMAQLESTAGSKELVQQTGIYNKF